MCRFGSYVMCMTVYRSSLIWTIYLMRFPLKIALGVYSLGVYCLKPQILDLGTHSSGGLHSGGLLWGSTVGV